MSPEFRDRTARESASTVPDGAGDPDPATLVASAIGLSVIVAALLAAIVFAGPAPRWIVAMTTPMLVGCLGLWGWAVLALRRRRGSGAPPRGVVIRRLGGRTLVRLPRFSPAHSAWGAAMWIAIASVPAVGLGLTARPAGTLAYVWPAMLLVGLAVLAQQRAAVARRRDLVIDSDLRQLTLAPDREVAPIPFDAIEDLRVETVMHTLDVPLAETDAVLGVSYAPRITWTDDAGDRRTIRIAVWPSEAKARSFVTWMTAALRLPPSA